MLKIPMARVTADCIILLYCIYLNSYDEAIIIRNLYQNFNNVKNKNIL